jgi:aminoglycoside 6'-N-acetyltransferase I
MSETGIDVVIEDLREELVQETAAVLNAAFLDYALTWHEIESALKEVRESLAEDRISRVALLNGKEVVGWVGGIRQYEGNVYELHPIAVRPDMQGHGIGAMLVRDLERLVRERGAHTLWLGCDDERGRTTLSATDLYPDIFSHIAKIRNLRQHPFEFYQKMGFVIVGVLPDANGPGKPDIFMAKRIS